MFTSNKKKLNRGSIRDGYEESDSEEEEDHHGKKSQPGPGSYLKEQHTSTFGKNSQKPENFQFFGSAIERFKTPGMAPKFSIGPGQYNTEQEVLKSVRLSTF